MHWILTTLLALLGQTAPPAHLPPAYPRAGATKILDNDRVQVWNIAWLKGQPSPLHRHLYDLVGVYYEPGDRMIISPEGAKRPVSTKAWDIAFQRKCERCAAARRVRRDETAWAVRHRHGQERRAPLFRRCRDAEARQRTSDGLGIRERASCDAASSNIRILRDPRFAPATCRFWNALRKRFRRSS